MITAKRGGTIDWTSIICTVYIFVIMISSSITVFICAINIYKQMKKKMLSDAAKKSQQQINLILLLQVGSTLVFLKFNQKLQFLFPFLLIHIPFYESFIFPIFNIENPFLANNLPFLFSWCPAINPILVMVMVKVCCFFKLPEQKCIVPVILE